MMNQQPDKFFRDKLENLQTPAPPAAWDRIESGLSKKNNTAFWLKIAASFLIVASAAFMLWPDQNESNMVANDGKAKPSKVDTVNAEKKSVPAETQSVKTENLVAEKKKTTSPDAKITSPVTRGKKQTAAQERIEKTHKSDPPVIQQDVPVVEETPVDITPNAVAIIEEKKSDEKNIKITITAAESEKFLNKNSLAQATPVEKKASTLQKLLDKAEDLTNNQDPFGDLRQKKNEILALNFRSEKNQRGQNK